MRYRWLFTLLIIAFLVWLVIAVRDSDGANREQVGAGVSPTRRIEGIGVQGWHARAVRNRRTINRLRRVRLADGNVVEAINLAAATYGHGGELWRKARCESHYRPTAHNSSGAAGLFQFLPSTWRSTPYRMFSVYSPYANALAAGWMHTQGRGGEWVCQ